MFVAAGLVAFIVGASVVSADFSLDDWLYLKPIVLAVDRGDETLVELFPDAEVFANSSPGLIDLRIVADDGTEVPFKLVVSRGERQRSSFGVSLRDKGHVSGQHTTFIADLGEEGVLHNEIEIRTPSRNFRRSATVEASGDGEAWTKIAEGQVYDFTVKEIPLTTRDTRVKYTDSTARYLRVRISEDGEGPLEITGATVFFVKETPPREANWPAAIRSTSRDTDRRTTLVELDLGVTGLPSHRLAVNVPGVNFYRKVNLEVSFDQEEWRALTAGASIYSYDTPKFVGSSLAITYPESTARHFRLVIFDEDNPPLDIQGVEVWGFQRRLVFAASPGKSHKLYYGNVGARQPSYDIERVFPYLATEALPQATLGPHAANPEFVAEIPPPEPVSERLPWLFPGAVALAAVMVALILFGVLRRAREFLPPPAE